MLLNYMILFKSVRLSCEAGKKAACLRELEGDYAAGHAITHLTHVPSTVQVEVASYLPPI